MARLVEVHLWQKASQHHCGKGAEKGVDGSIVQQKPRTSKKKGDDQEWGVTRSTVMGALWGPARKAEARGEAPPPSPSCQLPLTS